jgi:hypothetical protein
VLESKVSYLFSSRGEAVRQGGGCGLSHLGRGALEKRPPKPLGKFFLVVIVVGMQLFEVDAGRHTTLRAMSLEFEIRS